MADDVKITYEILFDLLRRERNREELQPLDKSFFSDVVNYMSEKQSLLSSDPSVVSADLEKARIQFQNIKKIIRELYDRREKKIVLLALNSVRTSSRLVDKSLFLPEELAFFNDLVAVCSKYRSEVLDRVLSQLEPFITDSSFANSGVVKPSSSSVSSSASSNSDHDSVSSDNFKVRFLKPVPKFVGANQRVFGPFSSGDEASLPEKIVSVLLKKGLVEVLNCVFFEFFFFYLFFFFCFSTIIFLKPSLFLLFYENS